MRVVITTIMFFVLTGAKLPAGVLHDAVEEGNLKRVKELLTQNPKSIDVKDVNDNTALYLSIMFNRREIAEYLFEQGAKTDIYTASYLGQCDIVKSLLQKKPDLIDAKDMHGSIALHYASTKEVIQCLLDNGADINSKNYFDGTPLQTKAARGDKALAEFLISRGAKVDIFTLCLMGKVDEIKKRLTQNPELLNTTTKNGDTLLHHAGNIPTARLLLDNGLKPGVTDAEGFMPIHAATIRNQVEIAEFLIKHGADVNAKSRHDLTPLHLAATLGLYDMANMLIQKGANVNSGMGIFSRGNTPIQRAVEKGDIKIVELLIQKGADIHIKNYMEETLLFHATTKEVAELLIEKGIDVNHVSNSSGWTALHEAATPEVAEVLISKGAKLNIKDKMERTPLDRAIEDERMDVAHFLISKGGTGEHPESAFVDPTSTSNENADIFEAAEQGLLEKVREFLDNDPNMATTRGGCADETPLHCTATREVAELLIRRGADIQVKDAFGRTPLHRAAEAGRTEVVQLLIDKGADVNARDGVNNTPLHGAAEYGVKGVVEILIENNADLNVANMDHRTPLSWAAEMGYQEIAELLIAAGAETKGIGLFDADQAGIINEVAPDMDIFTAVSFGHLDRVKYLLQKHPSLVKERDIEGNTPLHRTSDNNIASFLLSHGADVNARNNQGVTPLHYAAGSAYEVALVLIRSKADINAKDNRGFTALLIAAISRQNQIADSLIAAGAELNILEASALGDLDRIKSFLKANPKIINMKGPLGWTPLCVAVLANQKDTVELLLEQGATIPPKDKSGNSVLHMVNSKEVAEALIRKGADINAKGNHGRTPLHELTARNQKEIIKLLILKGADVTIKDDDKNTPLDIATKYGRKEITEILKKHIQSP